MDPRIVPLYYLCSIAGVVMVVGGIWLIYKQKIYIDSESKQVTEIETPIGKFKTNLPALVLFALGFFPLIYPIVQAKSFAQKLQICGEVEADTFPVNVYAIVKLDSLRNSRSFKLPVPFLEGVTEDYLVLYVSQNILDEQSAVIGQNRGGEIHLEKIKISAGMSEKLKPNPLPPVPDEFH
ncbi:MAG: hypothetical protein WAU45_07955 [Blastocatellia bacterium]